MLFGKKNVRKNSLFILGLLLNYLFSSCTFMRAAFYNYPDARDARIFASHTLPPAATSLEKVNIVAGNEFGKMFYSDRSQGREEDIFGMSPSRVAGADTLDVVLRSNGTSAFMVLDENGIVYEKYYRHSTDHAFQVFSVSKSFVGIVVGIAIEEGFIRSVEDSVKNYLPSLDPSCSGLRIIDLLDMRTGVDDSFLMTMNLYYSDNLKRTAGRIKMNSKADKGFHYSNWATQQLMFLVEAATGQFFPDYFHRKLWEPLGMEFPGYWSLDSKTNSNVRAFCGLSLAMRDLARFGMLLLGDGQWKGKEIISPSWIHNTLTLSYPDSDRHACSFSDYPYSLHWRIVREQQILSAIGLFGQFLYIDRENRRIIIRLGNRSGKVDWIQLFRSMEFVTSDMAP